MFRNTFPMRDNGIISLSLGDQGKLYDLSFGMYFLYTWCTREWCNPFGLSINHMFRNTFPMREY